MELIKLLLCVALFGLCHSFALKSSDGPRDHKQEYRAKLIQMSYKIMSDPELKAEWDERVTRSKVKRPWDPPDPTFNCDTSQTSPTVPTSVHALRAGDIKAVAAMGDSITAGNGVGAEDVLQVALENRGKSWSIGGDFDLDHKVITLPNILRKFNPDLKGASECMATEDNWRKSWLNAAEPGGDNRDMEHEAVLIADRCEGDPRLDCQNDWKIVTLFTGGNDLCGACDRLHLFNSTAYRAGVERGLDVLYQRMSRVFVNLVPMFDVTPLVNMTDGLICDLFHLGFCGCIFTHEEEMKQLQMAYYDELLDLVETGKYEREDFTVVIQPMLVESTPPIDPDTGNYDITFLSHDCFHPALKAHESFAYSLWNTMLIPVGEKPLFWPTDEENPAFYCPTPEFPYFFTKENSPQPAP